MARKIRWSVVVAAASAVVVAFLLFWVIIRLSPFRRPKPLPPAPRLAAARPLPAPAVLPGPPVPMTKDFAVPVLMYHRITNLTPREARSPLERDLTVAPTDFDRQVKYLKDNHFTFLMARDVETALRECKPLPKRAIVLTMDDGYKDNFECAFPILRKYGACATIFLVTNTVGTGGHLSWQDVLTMHRGQVGYGSHTVHHADLTQLPQAQVDYELCASKHVIESKLSEPITAVAYPAGKYNRMVAERAKYAGYLAGWKKGGGPVQPGDDMYLLPRVRVRGSASMEEFKRAVWSGVYRMERRNERAPAPDAQISRL